MNVKKFDSLHRRDFDNGAILDEIRTALKQRDDLRAALEALFAVIADVDTVYESETGRTIEQDFADELEQARAALAGEAGDGS